MVVTTVGSIYTNCTQGAKSSKTNEFFLFLGRFDDQVIEERRKSALRLLEFAATVPPLTRNVYFAKFFEVNPSLFKSIEL